MSVDRFEHIVSFLPECVKLAEIGCDHAKLTERAFERGKCVRAVVSDISDKCLAKARETLAGRDACEVPAVLVKNHGPFAWGKDAAQAVYNATVLEQVARMALLTEQIRPDVRPADGYLMDKHYFRKHGANAYYGQNNN